MKTASSAHAALYRLSSGRLGKRVVGMPVLLLTTTGRRSGRPRTTPLSYLEDGNELVLAASNGGNPWFPAWWLNLQANPRASVQVGPRRIEVTAREATPDQRDRLWPRFVNGYQGYGEYERRTTRRIPVVILSPVD